MSGDDQTLRVPQRVTEAAMNALGISKVTKFDGWVVDTYIDSAGNRIEDKTQEWLNGKDNAFCTNGAQPSYAQIQEAIRVINTGKKQQSRSQTEYHFNSDISPLEHMCEVAARPKRQR
jgi:hypothetical protein